MRVLIALCAALAAGQAFAASPAETAMKSVARIIVAVPDANGGYDISGGSAFAVAGNLLVTNEHVVQIARNNSAAVVFVAPPPGGATQSGQVIFNSDSADLALIKVGKAVYRPLAIADQRPDGDHEVFSLGYPGLVDDVYGRELKDTIEPTEPQRFRGFVSSYGRSAKLGGAVTAIVHDAKVDNGNSGGPLIDECGRVVGVNTAKAGAYSVSISAEDVLNMLKAAGAPVEAVTQPCVSAAAQQALDEQKARAEQARREQDIEAQVKALAAQQHSAEQERQGLSVLLGAVAAFGVVGWLLLLGRRRARKKAAGANTPDVKPDSFDNLA